MKNELYAAPIVKKFEFRVEQIVCQSDTPLGSTTNEGYEEEDFIW